MINVKRCLSLTFRNLLICSAPQLKQEIWFVGNIPSWLKWIFCFFLPQCCVFMNIMMNDIQYNMSSCKERFTVETVYGDKHIYNYCITTFQCCLIIEIIVIIHTHISQSHFPLFPHNLLSFFSCDGLKWCVKLFSFPIRCRNVLDCNLLSVELK